MPWLQTGSGIGSDDQAAECHDPRQFQARNAISHSFGSLERRRGVYGNVRLTKNPGGICQLAGMELQLGRDTAKADDNTIPVCTVTAFKEGDGN
jgi:hypothetical protein